MAPVLLTIQVLCYFMPSAKLEMVHDHLLHFMQKLQQTMSDEMESRQEEINTEALQSLVNAILDNNDIKMFIESIPDFFKTNRNSPVTLDKLLDPQQSKPN